MVGLNPTLQKTLRFSSITPDTVNRTDTHRLDTAGKGINTSRVLTQLGKKTVYLCQLGGEMRPLFLSLCGQDSLPVEWVESSSQIRFCYTLINDSDSTVTELVEEAEPVEAGTERRLLEKYDSLLPEKPVSRSRQGYEYLIVCGTKAAGFSDTLIPLMVRKAKERGLKVILDLRGKDLSESLQYEPDIIKPNLYEFASTFAPDLVKKNELIDIEDANNNESPVKKQIKALALDICKKHNCRIVLTRGGKKIWAAAGEDFFETDVPVVKPVNTTGCGDVFTSGLAAALGDGKSFSEAIAEGTRCATLNAGLFRLGVIY